MWFSHMSVYVIVLDCRGNISPVHIFMYYVYVLYIYLPHLHPQCAPLTSVKRFTCGVWVLSPHSRSVCMFSQQMNG